MTDHPVRVTGPIATGDTITITVDAPVTPPPAAFAFTTTIPEGAVLVGTVTWEATVTTGIANSFDFSVDGTVLWHELSAPWGGQFNTTTFTNGPHTLSVVGHSSTGENVSATAHVVFNNAVVVPPPSAAIYGPAINSDSKDNIRIGPSPNLLVGIRFLASQTSAITSVRFSQRWGSGYSLGTGGTLRVSVQADNAGVASGTDLGFMSFAPGNPGTATSYDNKTIVPAVGTTAGRHYWVILKNTDPNPNSNYISINGIYVYGTSPLPAGQGRQPRFADSDFGIYIFNGTTWTLQGRDTAVVDITYANGAHDGQGFIGMIGIKGQAVYAGAISGSSMVRERFTPTVSRVVTEAHVRVRRTGGTSPLTIELKQGSTVLASGSVPTSQVAISTSGGDSGGSSWVAVTFPPTALGPTTYDLVLSSGGTWTAAPIREGTDVGFAPGLSFPDGIAQETTNGTTWTDMYASSRLSLQFFLK